MLSDTQTAHAPHISIEEENEHHSMMATAMTAASAILKEGGNKSDTISAGDAKSYQSVLRQPKRSQRAGTLSSLPSMVAPTPA